MNLSADGRLRLAARLVFVAGLGSLAGNVSAQEAAPTSTAEAAPADGSAKQLGGVQVTGSRIKSVNLTSTSPVLSVDSKELDYQGTTRVEDLLNNLPQVFGDFGGNINNGSDGTATVNLRNLGASRTLVLIDGKRVAPGTPGDPNVDLNFIPSQLIERVDVLTGGASAVYGSDAVAGVVNFIFKKDFEGFRVDYQRSGYLHENTQDTYRGYNSDAGYPLPPKQKFDGGGNDVSILFGVNSGDKKGNATIYATYLQLDPIFQNARDFGNCQLSADSDTSYACGGSGTSFPGRFRVGPAGADNPRRDLTVNVPGTPGFDPTLAAGEFRLFNGATDLYNFNPLNYYQRPAERYSVGGSAHYQVNDAVDAYTQVMFSDYKTQTLAAPTGTFAGGPFDGTGSIDCGSPLLSAGQRAELCTSRGLTEATDRQTFSIARRNVEGGGRTQDYDRYQYRIITGLRGDFLKNWSYDASIQFGSATYQAEQGGYFSLTRLSNAINITTVDGVAQCASGVAGCVPYNIFGVGTVSPEALDYLSLGSLSSGSTTEQVATGAITGSLGDYGLKSPFAENGVGVSFGGEYRRETARFSTDEASRSGDLAGAGGAATAFDLGFAVKEVFAEIKIPLIEHQPLFEELSAEAGYRRSDYSSVNSTNTYKIAGEWAPTKDVRFRGGFNRAVRAPSIGDISDPTTVFLGGSSDPCAGLIDPETGVVEGGATRAQCLNDPLIAQNPGLYGAIDADPAAQYNARGGSGGLKPESAKTYTAGVVLTPTFIRNFTLSVDYFDIKVDNIIGRVGADTTLGLCYTSGLLCDRINRNPNQAGGAFGSLFGPSAGFTDDPISNQGFLLVRGIDLVSAYRIKLSQIGLSNEAGSLAFDMVATRSLKQDTQAFAELPDTRRSCNGQYGPICGTPAPLYRHKLRATYSVPVPLQDSLVSVSGAWRYLSGVNIDSGSAGGANDLDKHVSAESYIDMTASVTVSGAYTFRLGVQNVFDNNPPVIGSTALSATLGNGNTYPQVYDALGRYVFAGVTVDF